MRVLLIALLAAISYAQTEGEAVFFRSDAGICPEGWAYIDDESMCETAAIWAGFRDLRGVEMTNIRPRGCYVVNGHVWFNADDTFTNATDYKRNSLCIDDPTESNCYTIGVDFGGSDFDAVSFVPSAARCQEMCEWDWFCVMWTWRDDSHSSPHTCKLIPEGSVMMEDEDPNVISGPRQCPIKTACNECNGRKPEPLSPLDIVSSQNAGEAYIVDDTGDLRLALAYSQAEYHNMRVAVEPNYQGGSLAKYNNHIFSRSTSFIFVEDVRPFLSIPFRREWVVHTTSAEWISEERIGQIFHVGDLGEDKKNPVLFGYAQWGFTEDEYVMELAPQFYTGYQIEEELLCWGTEWYCKELGRVYMSRLGWDMAREKSANVKCSKKKEGQCYGFSIDDSEMQNLCVWSSHMNYCMEILKPKFIDLDSVPDEAAEHECNRKQLGDCYGPVELGQTKVPMYCAWLPQASSPIKTISSRCRAVPADELEKSFNKKAPGAPKKVKPIDNYCQAIISKQTCKKYKDCKWFLEENGEGSCWSKQDTPKRKGHWADDAKSQAKTPKLTMTMKNKSDSSNYFLFGITMISSFLLTICVVYSLSKKRNMDAAYDVPLTDNTERVI